MRMASLFSLASSILLVLVMAAYIAPAAVEGRKAAHHTRDPMAERFDEWIAEHGRRYKSAAEKAARFEIFKRNVRYIESFNAKGGRKFKLGINQFADLTNLEFNSMINNAAPPGPPGPSEAMIRESFQYQNMTDVPASIDWRAKGAVTPVKNQGTCGSCWAFASVATVESLTQIKTGKLVSLSEQQLIDCSRGDACNGGYAVVAYGWMIRNGGIISDDNYQYVGYDRMICFASMTAAKVSASITGYQWVPPFDEAALMRAVANQPVYVSINAGSNEFGYFSGDGIFNGDCGTSRHAVMVIGYGTDGSGSDYWLIKNSWGTWWGDGGFGKIARGGFGPGGMCNIARQPVYPIL